VPVDVQISINPDGSETWQRFWPGQVMRSRMTASRAGHVDEHFGLFAFTLMVTPHSDGLDMELVAGRVFGIPLPNILCPRITATEQVEGERHLFDVRIALPLIGQLVHYRGWLLQL
jgi:Domain of unknown function (DUF4166)